jgi:uncharacterized protein
MRIVLVLFLVGIYQLGQAQTAVPPLWGHRVHDDGHILTPSAADALEAMLKQHEDSTSNQIAVLIIPSLNVDVLEQYSLRVVEEWKLGKQDKDNGVLLLIVVNDKKMRIEVGEGLEGVLPDVIARRIIKNEIAPHFRKQNYDEGVKAGVEAIIKSIRGEYVDIDESENSLEMSLTERLITGVFIFGILGLFTITGLFVPGCSGWFLYAFLIPFYAIFPTVVVGLNGGLGLLLVYVIGFPILKLIVGRTAWGKKMTSSSGRRVGSGWTSGGGFSSGGGGWSSGGGGGFSGGGGSFGGGGSSGSW